MITVIAGSDRKDSSTLKVTNLALNFLKGIYNPVQLIDLHQFPHELFRPENYGNQNPKFKPYQDLILKSDGILLVIPEYNGSFPGALKYFIDLLKFPESFNNMPCAFIGVAAGAFGGLRAVEQMEAILHYRLANLYGQRVFFQRVQDKLSPDGSQIVDSFLKKLFEDALTGFIGWVQKLQK
ncbi:MAG: NAD(P)H-dependent oxidoreductase [Deltaproteobacteria bacterium]|nr:NAD(P)H-dependent oxidoreductase [Deltaproteobacteria bacterium]